MYQLGSTPIFWICSHFFSSGNYQLLMIPYNSKLNYFVLYCLTSVTHVICRHDCLLSVFQTWFEWNCRTVVSSFHVSYLLISVRLRTFYSHARHSFITLVNSSFPPQPGEHDQGILKGHDPCNPDGVCSGSLLARPASRVHRTPWFPLEAAGELFFSCVYTCVQKQNWSCCYLKSP